MMTDPPRLLDDPTMAASLRADLAMAKAAGLEGFDAAAGAASLSAAVAAEAGTTAAATTAGVSKTLLASIAGVVGAGALVWWGLGSSDPQPSALVQPGPAAPAAVRSGGQDPTPEPVPEVAPAVVPEAAAAAEPPAEDSSVSADEPAPTEAAPSPATPRGKRAKRTPTGEDYLREAGLISDARRALERDPKRALELLHEAKSSFPKGLLREEREALTVLALDGLGRTAQARRAAERFLRSHGKSPHADAVRQILE